jgi:hypothetical protein
MYFSHSAEIDDMYSTIRTLEDEGRELSQLVEKQGRKITNMKVSTV